MFGTSRYAILFSNVVYVFRFMSYSLVFVSRFDDDLVIRLRKFKLNSTTGSVNIDSC